MARERFDDAFERMRDQANRLAATERSTDNFDEIVEQRVELDRLRDEVTAERKHIVSRFEPPATEVVTPPRGYVHTRLFGKLAAGVSVVLLVVAGALFIRFVRDFDTTFPLAYSQVTESVVTDPGCRWLVEIELRNDSDEWVEIERVEAVLNRNVQRGVLIETPLLAPGETASMTASWNLLNAGGCTTVDQVNHGNVIIHLANGRMVSRGI